MVGIEMEDSISGPRRVSYVDASNSSRDEYSLDLSPGLVEIFVHGVVGGCGNICEEIIPDCHHWIRRGGHDEVD